MSGPTQAFWQDCFARDATPWHRGRVHPQLGLWLQAGVYGSTAATEAVLVPGCGHGHEVLGLTQAGYRVVGVDYAEQAVAHTCAALEQASLTAQVVQHDLLTWEPGQRFAAIHEQTCLCALHPDHWQAYAQRLYDWLIPGGALALLAVQRWRPSAREGWVEGPPYHCDINAVRALFPSSRWAWTKPPYARTGQLETFSIEELAIVLRRL